MLNSITIQIFKVFLYLAICKKIYLKLIWVDPSNNLGFDLNITKAQGPLPCRKSVWDVAQHIQGQPLWGLRDKWSTAHLQAQAHLCAHLGKLQNLRISQYVDLEDLWTHLLFHSLFLSASCVLIKYDQPPSSLSKRVAFANVLHDVGNWWTEVCDSWTGDRNPSKQSHMVLGPWPLKERCVRSLSFLR